MLPNSMRAGTNGDSLSPDPSSFAGTKYLLGFYHCDIFETPQHQSLNMSETCRLLPHGGYSLIPTVLTTMAWVASVFQDGCDYAIMEGPIVGTITDDHDSAPWIEVGYDAYRTPYYNRQNDAWEVTYTGRCTGYDTNRVTLDPAWKAAKAFAFLALVLGGGGALFLWFSACCVFSKATWRWAGYEVLLAAIFQALAFLWFGNSMCHYRNTCTLSWGSKADILACAFWGLASLCIFCKYPVPTLPPTDPPGMQRARETTDPEIAVTPQHPSTSNQRRLSHFNSPTTKVATTAIQSSCAGSSQVEAALPLEWDPAATPSWRIVRNHCGEFIGGKPLKDVEVL